MSEERGFFERVYEVARMIPHGRVTSYGAIARYLGSPGAARMVGWAMNGAHKVGDIPAFMRSKKQVRRNTQSGEISRTP